MRKFLTAATLTACFAGFAGVAFADGAEVYAKKCANCHGKDGNGKTKMGEKLKIKAISESKGTDADFVKAISDGIKADGKEKMPAFKGKLSDPEIAELAKYSKTLK